MPEQEPGQEPRAVLLVAASAGGVEPVLNLLGGLEAGLPVAVMVVVHIPAGARSALPTLIGRVAQYPASHPQDGEPLRTGHIYVAPPDAHLLIGQGRVRLSHGPRINRVRPSADPLFQTAARAYGPQVIGVVLSGSLDDGTVGMMAVKLHGGRTVAQDPEEAAFPGMPASAIAFVDVDHVVSVEEMPPLIKRLVGEVSGLQSEVMAMEETGNGEIEHADEIIQGDREAQSRGERHGGPSMYTCPECGGVIWQLQEDSVVRFQCHTGHAYSLQSMLVEQAELLESALWSAIRSLQEKASLARQALVRFKQTMSDEVRLRYEEQAEAAERNVEVIKRLIESGIFSAEYEQTLAERATEEAGEPLEQERGS